MSEQKKTKHIAVTLKGETRKKAIEIKEKLGIQSWADMLRYLISQYHRRNIENESRQ